MTNFICCPLKKNVPVPRDGWVDMKCPVCGQECWMSDNAELALSIYSNAMLVCTECALRQQ